MACKLILLSCLALSIVFASSGPAGSFQDQNPSRMMKIIPNNNRIIPIYSRHVREADGGWKVEPKINRDSFGNTAGSVRLQKEFGDEVFYGNFSKVFSGPNSGGPSYIVGATFRW